MTNRNVRNNWALLAGVSLVSFGGAALYLAVDPHSLIVPAYFLCSSIGLAVFAALWFRTRPPAMRAPAWAYVVVVAGLEVGAFVGGALESTRTFGAWFAVGLAFVAYGVLERSAVIATTGAAAAVLTLVLLGVNETPSPVLLEVVTGLVFGGAALVIRGIHVGTSDKQTS